MWFLRIAVALLVCFPLMSAMNPPARVGATTASVRDGLVHFASGPHSRIGMPDGSTRALSSLIDVRHGMRFGDFVWKDRVSATGPVWVRVDLRRQIASVFRGGDEIGTAVILYGADDRRTPHGMLHVLAKARVHRSSLYDADMPYTLRLTDDGVSLHASEVVGGRATHGCIGLPPGFASRLFDAMSVGDLVAVS